MTPWPDLWARVSAAATRQSAARSQRVGSRPSWSRNSPTLTARAVSDWLFATWLLTATTGMRRGELLGLRWCDVDLDAGAVSVRQIRTVARYDVLTLTPKTDKGVRTIAVDPETLAGMRAYRVAQMEERLHLGSSYRDSGDLVFTREDGSPIHPERLSSMFRQRCSRSGLPAIRLHDVRHSYVRACLARAYLSRW
jgi:integrase